MAIPARNEETFIGDCLESILAQDFAALQVIVIDGASTDRTAAIVRALAEKDPRVELIHNPAGVIPISLNLGLAAARGRWFVRVDAHSTIPPGYVSGLVEHLASDRWGGAGGRKDGVGITPAGRAIAAAMGSRFGVGGSTYHHGTRVQVVEHLPFGAYPTELVRKLGGWDERLLVNQDFELDYRIRRAGYQLLFDPQLVIHWHCRQSVRDLFKQYRRYGKDKANVAFLHPRSVRLRQVAPSVMVAAWVVAVALARRRPTLAAALLAPYPVAVTVAGALTARSLDRRARRRIPPAFAAMHVGWGIGFLELGVRLIVNGVTGRAPSEVRPGTVPPVVVRRRPGRGDPGVGIRSGRRSRLAHLA